MVRVLCSPSTGIGIYNSKLAAPPIVVFEIT
jgi:hypothetical protein